MGHLKVSTSKQGKSMTVAFDGQIDEDAVLAGIDFSGCEEATFDMAKIDAINSCGIREWVKWIKGVPPKMKLTFVNCPRPIVDQLNLVDGFIPSKLSVQSFFVPYFCEACSNVTDVLFAKGKEFKGSQVSAPDNVKCSACGKIAEMDVVPSKYFKFLDRGV